MLIFEEQQQNTSTLIQPLWKSFNKELAKQLFKPMDAQEFKTLELTIQVENLNGVVNKLNNTKSLMIGLKLKDAIKLNIVKLDKSEKYQRRM